MQIPTCDLHTHTTFCDGKNTPEEMVCAAIADGMTLLGFSAHAPTPGGTSCMKPELANAYEAEIGRLKSLYADQIEILCGVELDSQSLPLPFTPDYRIGSVHHVCADGVSCPIDASREAAISAVREHFGGDWYRWTRAYFETLCEFTLRRPFEIAGHLDLVLKFNEGDCLFDSSDRRYRKPLLDTIDLLVEKHRILEINTGAISRGYRTEPYPIAYALRRIAERRGRVILSSDAHQAKHLRFGFSDAVRYAKSCGIGGLTVCEHGNFVTKPIGAFF